MTVDYKCIHPILAKKHNIRLIPNDFLVKSQKTWKLSVDILMCNANSSLYLRSLINEVELKKYSLEYEQKSIPDDLLITAAKIGAISNIAFIDIIDNTFFERAICLCCYNISQKEKAVTIRTLDTFKKYYNIDSYIKSKSYIRNVATMMRDLKYIELSEVRDFISRLKSTPSAVREINRRCVTLCVAVPECKPKILWVYSTPSGRRFLRFLARKGGYPIKITVASSDSNYLPRFRFRMYAASIIGPSEVSILEIALKYVNSIILINSI